VSDLDFELIDPAIGNSMGLRLQRYGCRLGESRHWNLRVKLR
jgi:hypothetical protein